MIGVSERPSINELHGRIQGDIEQYRGALPERVAIAWSGYLAALLEWDLVTVVDHDRLTSLLPPVDDNPVYHILVGRGD
jgi:hypothetical protein